MEARSRVTDLVDQLIVLFNRRSDDLPDGLFDRRTQFLVNGVAFEEMLGRSPSDPLVLMLTRGPAGYRFSAKALLHAIPDARIERGEFAAGPEGGAEVVNWQCWLSGHLRGTGDPTETVFDVTFKMTPSGIVERASIAVDEASLTRIRDARLRS